MDKRKDASIAILFILTVIAIGTILYVRQMPFDTTNDRITEAINQVAKLDNAPPEMELDIKDGWDHPLVLRFTKSAIKLTYTVISRGPDGKLDTDDDIKREWIDRNIAKAVGEWTAEKAKEFLKGVRDGIGKKSKFEGDQDERGSGPK